VNCRHDAWRDFCFIYTPQGQRLRLQNDNHDPVGTLTGMSRQLALSEFINSVALTRRSKVQPTNSDYVLISLVRDRRRLATKVDATVKQVAVLSWLQGTWGTSIYCANVVTRSGMIKLRRVLDARW